jgi:hypothetical protein
MNSVKKWILIAATSFCTSVLANSSSMDLSDTWWNVTEAGWGVNVNHQQDTIFLTFFLYGKDGRGAWYTGQASRRGETGRGAIIFAGDVTEFRGPTNGAPFNSAPVIGRKVGTVTFTAFLDSATISYSIDDVEVEKIVTRLTLRINDPSGLYTGVMKDTQSLCFPPFANGEFTTNANLSISATPNKFSMSTQKSDGAACLYDGNYIQTGRYARSKGTYTCTGGLKGTYDAFAIEAGPSTISGEIFQNGNLCDAVGSFVGLRK